MDCRIRSISKLSLLAAALLWVSGAYAGTFSILHGFTGGTDGGASYSNLTPDSAGNVYGTTVWGGSTNCDSGCGVVFELSPATGGGYTETVIYTFLGSDDGNAPGNGVIFDAAGNLYGTTFGGGPHNGDGTVFELTPSGGSWTKSILYTFPGGNKGGSPLGLVFDASGNLYGNASYAGAHGYGVVYQLTPGSPSWTEHIVHAFTGGNDGAYAYGNLAIDSAGNIYGTAINGGAHGHGLVFEFEPQSGGTWKEVALHDFTGGADGANASGGVTLDASGNVYGTTTLGGNTSLCTSLGGGCGVIFKLTQSSSGWKESVIHTFTGGNDGATPQAQIIFDSAGDIYGTAAFGGSVSTCPYSVGCGTVYKLTPGTSGEWSLSPLHRFTNRADGAEPVGTPYLDASGNLFATASAGASTACTPTGGCGTIFEIAGVGPEARK
jgi:uncharacterized repeat protein (TIGR03803 family)